MEPIDLAEADLVLIKVIFDTYHDFTSEGYDDFDDAREEILNIYADILKASEVLTGTKYADLICPISEHYAIKADYILFEYKPYRFKIRFSLMYDKNMVGEVQDIILKGRMLYLKMGDAVFGIQSVVEEGSHTFELVQDAILDLLKSKENE